MTVNRSEQETIDDLPGSQGLEQPLETRRTIQIRRPDVQEHGSNEARQPLGEKFPVLLANIENLIAELTKLAGDNTESEHALCAGSFKVLRNMLQSETASSSAIEYSFRIRVSELTAFINFETNALIKVMLRETLECLQDHEPLLVRSTVREPVAAATETE